MKLRMSAQERFERLTVPEPMSGCLLWLGKTRGGYGAIKIKGKNVGAHRFAWEQSRGPIPAGLFVCHRCDNPPCVRLDHLFLGTNVENIRDALTKGRRWGTAGEAQAASKLTAATVREIRRRYIRGAVSQAELAKVFGVAQTGISAIIRRKSWRHVLLIVLLLGASPLLAIYTPKTPTPWPTPTPYYAPPAPTSAPAPTPTPSSAPATTPRPTVVPTPASPTIGLGDCVSGQPCYKFKAVCDPPRPECPDVWIYGRHFMFYLEDATAP